MNKLGVSTLIVTVIIIGMTVSLIAVVFTFGKNLFDTSSKSLEDDTDIARDCNEVDFSISDVKCDGTNKLESITVINNVAQQIDGFILEIKTDTGQVNSATALNPNVLSSLGIVTVSPVGIVNAPSEIRVLPLIEESGELKICSKVKTIDLPSDHECRV